MPPPAEGFATRLLLGPALRSQPDQRLVTLVRDGYETAFEEIVRRYGRQLRRYAASIVGNHSEDVTQDAFSKALLALRRDDAAIDLRPWLFRIVRNTALNDLRDRPPSPAALAEALAGGHDPAEELEQREELADLMRRLQALPEPQRAAIVMRELEGLGHEEIAAALGLSGGGARQAIYRARRALRDGAGMLLPLPLLRLLVDHATEAAGAGTGAGGAIAAAGASAGGAGAGGALKLGVVAAVLAGSVGAGVAVHDHPGGTAADAAAIATKRSVPPSPALGPGAAAVATVEDSRPSGDEPGGGRRGQGGSALGGSALGGGPTGGEPPHRGPRNDGLPHAGGRHGKDRGERDGRPHGGPGPDRHGGGSGPGREDGGGGPLGGERHGGRADEGSSGPGGGGELRPPDGSGHGGDAGSDGGSDPSAPPPPPDEGEESGGPRGDAEAARHGEGEEGRDLAS
jgi:RNA polymerase sigma factor (sigma-70 family)